MIIMFSKDEGKYDSIIPIIIIILVSGFILHLVILLKWIKSLKHKKDKRKRYNIFSACTYGCDFNNHNYHSYKKWDAW